jgi:hypothetical protein
MDYKCIYSIYPNLEGIQKDGTFKYQISFQEKQIYGLNCLFKKKIIFYQNAVLKDERVLMILDNSNKNFYKKQTIQSYILFKLKYKFTTYIDKESEYIYYFFYKKQNFNNVAKYIYVTKYINKQDFQNNYTKNMSIFIKYMAAEYYLFKLKFNVPDKEFFINIFYRYYIKILKDEISKKYGKDIIIDFENYHSIYLFLKEKNYVSIFYKKIKKEILDEYNNFKIFIKNNKKDINNFQENLNSIYFRTEHNINLTKPNINKINKQIKIMKINEE